MLKHLHLRLTILFSGISIGMLAVLIGSILFISEQNQKNIYYISFLDNIRTLISSFQKQNVVDDTWLYQLKWTKEYHIRFLDNGQALLYNKHSDTPELDFLFKKAEENMPISEQAVSGQEEDIVFLSCRFSNDGMEYYAVRGAVYNKNGVLEVLALSDESNLRPGFLRQRWVLFGIGLLGSILLVIFTANFIKVLLRPIYESQKQQADFISAVSHELRTPLAAMLSSIQAGRRLNETQRERQLEVAEAEGKRMGRLIEDMLMLSYIEGSSWSIQPVPCQPEIALLHAADAFGRTAKEKGIRLLISLPDELPPLCRMDSERIRQVLCILLNNAVAYTPAGGKVILSMQVTAKKVLYVVTDNGPGIPDEEKEHIFQRFYQMDASRGNQDHFGLGLCIAKEITVSHKGDIYVEDAKGGGAVFTVQIPFLKP